jgi:hypothetical protein
MIGCSLHLAMASDFFVEWQNRSKVKLEELSWKKGELVVALFLSNLLLFEF